MRKFVTMVLFALLMNCNLYAFSLADTTTMQEDQCITLSSNNVETVNILLDNSKNLVSQSSNLLSIASQLLNNIHETHLIYVQAMLRLSDDIGKMADRIGEMADRILATEKEIGYMADRIVETEKLIMQNIALTQANLLKAQQLLNQLLLQFQ